MKKPTLTAAALVCLGVFSSASASEPGSSSGWSTVAPGVIERIDADGSVTRMGFGDDAARFDLALYEKQLADMSASGAATRENIDNLNGAIRVLRDRVRDADALKDVIAAPVASGGPILFAEPGLFGYNNTPTPACGFVAHQIADFGGDASLNPSGGSGEATASVVYYGYTATYLTYTATIYASATATGYGGLPVTSNGSTTASGYTPVTMFKKTASSGSTYFSVSASTSSYINVAGCAGGYQSYSKTQAL